MRHSIASLLLFASCLAAQEGVDKARVPLHDPGRPAHVRVNMLNGGITVNGYDGKEVLVESRARSGEESHHSRPPKADGMRLLNLPGGSGLEVVEDNNVVTVKTTDFNRATDLVISVPRRSSLELKCMNNGDISVSQVDGEIDANNLNGKVTLKNVSGSVLAHSLNGEVTVSMDRVDGSKPMSFSTLNGDIDVTLPGSTRASVRMKTDNGEIYSDFEVKLDPTAAHVNQEGGKQPDGTFKLKFDHTLRGTINGGGPEFQFTSFNGRIYIRRSGH
jgi:hypothetical protein